MFRFRKKLPIADDLRIWTDEGFERLGQMLGMERMMRAKVVLPNDECFPDAFDGSKSSAVAMAGRVAEYMEVSADSFVIEIFAEGEASWTGTLLGSRTSDTPAGLYHSTPVEGRFVIGLQAKKLKEPDKLVATLAHELAHVLLLGGKLLEPNAADMEPMTDLATIFTGMGVFTSSTAYQFKQWTDSQMQGWTSEKQGYLPEPVWGYALAKFAHLRGEIRPTWAKALPDNIAGYFRQSERWLKDGT